MNKKLLIITDCPSPYKLEFLKLLQSSYDLTIYFQHETLSDRDNRWYGNLKGFNYKVLPSNNIKRFFLLLFADIKNYDLFWNMNYATLDCILMSIRFRLTKKINLMHADGGVYIKRNGFTEFIMRKVMNFNHYFTSSGIMNDQYYQKYRIDKSKIYHYHFSSIHNDDLCPSNKSLIHGKPVELLSVGRIMHGKGFDVLIKAINGIENIKLTIVGGEVTEQYNQLIADNDVTDIVKFVPFVVKEDLKQYYKQADIFILPTRSDVWGLVINEAIAFGLPVISTYQCGAMVQLNQTKPIGCIYDCEDVDALHNAIISLFEDKKYYELCSRNANNLANLYTIEQMAVDYHHIFESIFKV